MLKPTLACLLGFSAATAFGASNIDPKGIIANPPTATAKLLEANYCFAEAHGIVPERLPVPPLVLRLRFQVSYHDSGNRPLILPLDHELTLWMSRTPGVMKVLHQPAGLMAPSVKLMTHLPADVSAGSPTDPKNDVFGVVPAGGDMISPIEEDVTLQIYKKSLRQSVDLRGHRVYLKLQLDHQPLAADLEAQLSDRWTKFGMPWTGGLRTNTVIIDVPSTPDAKKCPDISTLNASRQKVWRSSEFGK